MLGFLGMCVALDSYTIKLNSQITVPVNYKSNGIAKWECYKDSDCLAIAEAIYFEARGEPVEGQIAVGWVVLNRTTKRYFPNTPKEVITQGCQFEYRCNGKLREGIQEPEAFENSLILASEILAYKYKDPTKGSDHYLNKKLLTRTPYWSIVYPQMITIGKHTFFKRNHS